MKKIKLLISSQIKINYWNKKYQFTTREIEIESDGGGSIIMISLYLSYVVLLIISHTFLILPRVEQSVNILSCIGLVSTKKKLLLLCIHKNCIKPL